MDTNFTKYCLLFFLVLSFSFMMGQEKTIKGKVVDEGGEPLPGASVTVKGTSRGVSADFDGDYSIRASQGEGLKFSFVGMKDKTQTVGSSDTINITLVLDMQIEEVVVTALGIKRSKKSQGFSSQQIKGDQVSTVKDANFLNSLSGKIAGLDIKPSGNLGGSTNVIIRGFSSLTGNNQALFVVDGTPISNLNTNSIDQRNGRGGYDYGNAATDINPDDIEDINVLKGAAATALYGSRGANGVVMITTKRGKQKESGIGVTINSTVLVGTVDNSTLPKYQNQYGAGYGRFYGDTGYFLDVDINNDGVLDLVVPTSEDASFGAPLDGRCLIYQWNSLYPELDTYQTPTPYVAGAHTPNDIFKHSYNVINSVALDGGTDKSTFRLGYTNFNMKGIWPNSRIERNTVNFSGTHDFSSKLKGGVVATYTKTYGRRRNGTGYDKRNLMQSFRQRWQVNNDLFELRDAYFKTRKNITWNPKSPTDLDPIYFDNPYFELYENYQTDTRNRSFGNVHLTYDFNYWANVLGRVTFDTYDELQEERINIGSVDVSEYSRYNNSVSEYNYDLIFGFNKDLNEKFNIEGNVGFSLRHQRRDNIRATTNGGLRVPELWSLSNSVDILESPKEEYYNRFVDGIYARTSLGYGDYLFFDGSIRRDRSSTLPKSNNAFVYFSLAGSVLFSNLFNFNWLNFGKLRFNYAEVGNDTEPYNVFTTYDFITSFNSTPLSSNSSTLNNINLKPERTESYEIGIEASMFNRRVTLDFSYYDNLTLDQITPVEVSRATGISKFFTNAGSISNKGFELSLGVSPIKNDHFEWNIQFNWAKNNSEVVELFDGLDNLQIGNFQGGVSVNATPGEPYGNIRGSDFVYHENGQPIVNSSGYYKRTSTFNHIIGNINPDWKGGVRNNFKYKNVSLGFLIDVQKGGDVFSLDTWYGFATGLYDRSVGFNELGNPIRNTLEDEDVGGVILPGVQEDGTPNTVRARTDNSKNPYGYIRAPNKMHVYDASYVKLREASFTYHLPKRIVSDLSLKKFSISLIGKNLWIIHKNIPYSDPEAGLSSGNIQGVQSGAHPTVREIGGSIKIQF